MKKLAILFFSLSSLISQGQTDSVQKTFLIIGENESYSQVIGVAPYITSLTAKGTSFTNFNAITHPSQPNYIVFGAATTLQITDDADHGARSKTIPNLYTQLNAVGKKAECYLEGLPAQGSTVFVSGKYYAKHDPFYYFSNIPAAQTKPFTMFNVSTASEVNYVVPDICNCGHGSSTFGCAASVILFDNWLKNTALPQSIINYCLNPANKSRCIITFDEGSSSSNKIVLIMLGYGVKQGATVSTSYNHYNLFNTLLKPYGAASCNNAVGLPSMAGWETTSTPPPPVDTTKCYKTVTDSLKVIRRIDTTFKWNVTTRQVEIPCTPPPPVIDTTNYEYHTLYVNYEDVVKWLVSPAMYLSWAKNQGFNCLILYGRSLMVTTANQDKIANLTKLSHQQYGFKDVYIDARADGKYDEMGNMSTYLNRYSDPVYRINFVTEREPYNTGDYAGFWPFLKNYSKFCHNNNMIFSCYMGHPTQQGWDSIVFYCDKIFLSKYISMATYNAGISYNYVAGRWGFIAVSNKKLRPNNICPTEYIVSLESVAQGDLNNFEYDLYVSNSFFGSVWQKDITDYKTKSTADVLKYTRLVGEAFFTSKNALKLKPIN